MVNGVLYHLGVVSLNYGAATLKVKVKSLHCCDNGTITETESNG